jgi:cyclic pyranopterin monophosphate synthase
VTIGDTPGSNEPTDSPGLSHIDSTGRARMVNVSDKPWTKRRAIARGFVAGDMTALLQSVTESSAGSAQLESSDVVGVLAAARAVGLDSARKTAQLIPLCHPLPVSDLDVRFDVRPSGITIEATAEVVAPTGVEMEALTACLFAALSLVALLGPTQSVSIDDVVLWEKSGGRSGHWVRPQVLAAQ